MGCSYFGMKSNRFRKTFAKTFCCVVFFVAYTMKFNYMIVAWAILVICHLSANVIVNNVGHPASRYAISSWRNSNEKMNVRSAFKCSVTVLLLDSPGEHLLIKRSIATFDENFKILRRIPHSYELGLFKTFSKIFRRKTSQNFFTCVLVLLIIRGFC